MMNFIGSRKVVAQFVADILESSLSPLPSITITPQERCGGFSVNIVIDTSSAGTDADWAMNYCDVLMSIWQKNIQAG